MNHSIVFAALAGLTVTSILVACQAQQPTLSSACEVPSVPVPAVTSPPHSIERTVVTCSRPNRDTLAYLIEPRFSVPQPADADRGREPAPEAMARVTWGRLNPQLAAIMEVASRSTVRVDYPPEAGRPVTTDVAFYLVADRDRCATQAELHTLTFLTLGTSAWKVGDPVATGICIPIRTLTPDERARLGSVSTTALNILDYRVTDDQQLQLIAYAEGRTLVVLEHTRDARTRRLASFSGSEVLPSGCGQYLMGARLLPQTTKIALAFKYGRLRMVDYANPSRPPLMLYENLSTISNTVPNSYVVDTCEGFIPSFMSLRSDFAVDTLTANGNTSYTLRLSLGRNAAPLTFPVEELARR